MNAVKQINVKDLKTLIHSGKIIKIIDVRTEEEREEVKIENTLHVPLDELPHRINTFSKDDEIYFHCKSGKRSALACTVFTQAGFQNISNVIGGISAWQSENQSCAS
jgi:rhodanese-related sulfurtransferase